MAPIHAAIKRLEQAAPITSGENQARISRIVCDSNDIFTRENRPVLAPWARNQDSVCVANEFAHLHHFYIAVDMRGSWQSSGSRAAFGAR